MSKKKKIIRAKLIANPGSGTSTDRGKLLEQVTRLLKDRGIKIDVAVAKPKEKAIPIARKAVKDGYKLIIAMGGDDTIEAIIRGMGGSKARLGMLPVGTANNLAKSLGIPMDIEQACDLIAEGHFRKLDMGQVKMKKGKKLPFFELVMVGIGSAIYTDALHVSKGKKPIESLKGAIKTVLTHETRPKVTVQMDGESNVTVETMLAMVANVPLIGPNMLLDPDALMDDGLLDVSLYPNFSKGELLTYTAKSMNKDMKPVEDGKIQRYRAAKITIKSKPKMEVMADGVMLGKGKIKIKVLPGALRVIAPEVGAGLEKPPHEAGADLPSPVAPVVDNSKPENKSEPEKQPESKQSSETEKQADVVETKVSTAADSPRNS